MTRLFSARPVWEMEKPSTFKRMPTRGDDGRVPAPPRPAWMSDTGVTSKRDTRFLELAARERDLTVRGRQARSPGEVERLDQAWRELRRDMQAAPGNFASGWRARQKDWENGGRKANLKTVEKIRAREIEEQAVITRAAPASAGAVNIIQMRQRRSVPGAMTGYFSVFNTWYPCNDGGGVFMESVAPGAFTRTFRVTVMGCEASSIMAGMVRLARSRSARSSRSAKTTLALATRSNCSPTPGM